MSHSMSMTFDAWLQQRAARLVLAEATLRDPDAAARLLAGWTWADRPAEVAAVVARAQAVGDGGARIAAWWGASPAQQAAIGPARPEEEWELLAWGEGTANPPPPAVATLAWLGRIGEEYAARERDAWREARHAADADEDEAALEMWRALLGGRVTVPALQTARRLLGGQVRRAFAAVARGLGLPESVVREHNQRLKEAVDDAVLAAHREVAARVLETADEPISALTAAIDDRALPSIQACLRRRGAYFAAWSRLAPAVDRVELLAEATEIAITHRLLDGLDHAAPEPGPTSLPGWTVVRNWRDRLRGRLRAVLRDQPDAMLTALSELDGLASRTRAAAGYFAWAWAWREARVGFSLSMDGTREAPCVPPAPEDPPLDPLPASADRAVLTLLLCLIGRGCMADLDRWLGGTPGRELSPTFYRYLALAPDTLADPASVEGRARSFKRLRAHLMDGGLASWDDALRAAARRIGAVPIGRGLRERLQAALEPEWDASAIPLPEHHLQGFVERFAAWLRG
jgi:hypothetical protein